MVSRTTSPSCSSTSNARKNSDSGGNKVVARPSSVPISPDLGNQRTGNIQFNRRLWRWLHLSRKCHAKGGKRRQECGKRRQRKEKAGCGNLPQLAEFVRLATPLARFGKVVRTASKQ